MRLLAIFLLVALATAAIADDAVVEDADEEQITQEQAEEALEEVTFQVGERVAEDIAGAVLTINDVFGNPGCEEEDAEKRKRSPSEARRRKRSWLGDTLRNAWAGAKEGARNALEDMKKPSYWERRSVDGQKEQKRSSEDSLQKRLFNHPNRPWVVSRRATEKENPEKRGWVKNTWEKIKKIIRPRPPFHYPGPYKQRRSADPEENQENRQKRGFLKKVWRKARPIIISTAAKKVVAGVLAGKRSADQEEIQINRERRGWLKKAWRKAKPHIIAGAVKGVLLSGKRSAESEDNQEPDEAAIEEIQFQANLEELKGALDVLNGVVAVASGEVPDIDDEE